MTADRYTRTVRTPGGAAVIELIPDPGQGYVLLRARLSPPGAISDLAAGCRRLLDADADPAAIDAALAADGLLAPLVRARPGLRVPGSYDGFELAVRAVLGQQVSVAAARTFAGRLAAQHGPPAPPGSPPGLTALFPAPAELAERRPVPARADHQPPAHAARAGHGGRRPGGSAWTPARTRRKRPPGSPSCPASGRGPSATS